MPADIERVEFYRKADATAVDVFGDPILPATTTKMFYEPVSRDILVVETTHDPVDGDMSEVVLLTRKMIYAIKEVTW